MLVVRPHRNFNNIPATCIIHRRLNCSIISPAAVVHCDSGGTGCGCGQEQQEDGDGKGSYVESCRIYFYFTQHIHHPSYPHTLYPATHAIASARYLHSHTIFILNLDENNIVNEILISNSIIWGQPEP